MTSRVFKQHLKSFVLSFFSGGFTVGRTMPDKSQDNRTVVELLAYKGAWTSKPADGSGGDAVLFIRKSSMRDKKQWPSLQAGSRVSITMKVSAGRAIVSDAVLEE